MKTRMRDNNCRGIICDSTLLLSSSGVVAPIGMGRSSECMAAPIDGPTSHPFVTALYIDQLNSSYSKNNMPF
jgi:hypothetical protein